MLHTHEVTGSNPVHPTSPYKPYHQNTDLLLLRFTSSSFTQNASKPALFDRKDA